MSEYDNDEAIIRLSAEELGKYITNLSFYLRHQEDKSSLIDSIGNAIEISTWIEGLNSGYIESQIPALEAVLKVLENAIPEVKDRALHDLLQENLGKIKIFLQSVKTETPSEHPSYQYKKYPYYEKGKKMASEMKNTVKLSREGLSEDWRSLTEAVAYEYSHPMKDPRGELEEYIDSCVDRLHEKKEWAEKWNTYHKSEELNKPITMNEVLRQLASKICKEHASQ